MPSIEFKGKTAVQYHHLAVPHHQLVPQKDKSLTDTVSLHDNLIIQGDNLLALKALLPTYAGKVKCIYIDPPYNTGNEGWVYNDKVNSPIIKEWIGQTVGKEGEDLTRHDKWLCMMLPRLKLLRELLSDDGAIFVSIDDNEQHHLRQLMDDVFESFNFVGSISVVNNLKGRNDKKNIAQTHEYILIYAKSDKVVLSGLPLTDEQKSEFKYTDDRGQKYALRDLRKRGRPDRREDRPNMYFPIYFNTKTRQVSLSRKSEEEIEITPKRGDGSDGRWRWGKEKVEANLGILHARYSTKNDRWDVEHRVYLNEISGGKIPGDDDLDEDEGGEERLSKSKSIWFGGELSTDVGRRELLGIIPEADFDYPKSVNHIKRVISMANCKDGYVLDSFAGSGTTAQAVLELNKEDNGNRKFILVEMEEYANWTTAERIRRVIKGVPTATSQLVKDGLGSSFSYFTLGNAIELENLLNQSDLPAWIEMARYVFYTGTGEEFDSKNTDETSGCAGKTSDEHVYVYYKSDMKWLRDYKFTLEEARQLRANAGTAKHIIVYAPAKYVDNRSLDELNISFCQLPYEIYRLAK